MAKRLIISDNRDVPGNPLVLDGEAIDAAARDPQAIGKMMVDQVWAEGTDPTGGCGPTRRATRPSTPRPVAGLLQPPEQVIQHLAVGGEAHRRGAGGQEQGVAPLVAAGATGG
jgi:hypothetical protein